MQNIVIVALNSGILKYIHGFTKILSTGGVIMSYEINETTSMILQRSLASATKSLEASMIKISYGKQVSAVEDAANLIISEEMEAKRRGSQQAIENAQTGMNMLATAEAGLGQVGENLQRIKELSIQRENGTYSDEDRAAIDKEISQLTQEIDRVTESTSFNDIKLLNGESSDVTLQIGADSEAGVNTLNVGEALGSGLKASDMGIDDPTSPDFMVNIDNAIKDISSRRANIGASMNRLDSAISNLSVQNENLTAAQSRIIDTDVAAEVSNLTKSQILQNSSASLMSQANQSASIASILL